MLCTCCLHVCSVDVAANLYAKRVRAVIRNGPQGCSHTTTEEKERVREKDRAERGMRNVRKCCPAVNRAGQFVGSARKTHFSARSASELPMASGQCAKYCLYMHHAMFYVYTLDLYTANIHIYACASDPQESNTNGRTDKCAAYDKIVAFINIVDVL